MTFRRRIALLTGLAVAVAIILASALAYTAIAAQLRGQVDDSLEERASAFVERVDRRRGILDGRGGPPPGADGPGGRGGPPPILGGAPPRRPGGADFYEQLVAPDGSVRSVRDDGDTLPVDGRVASVAGGEGADYLDDATVAGDEVRMLVVALPGGGAIQVARSLAETDDLLERVRVILFLVALGGIGGAALLGRVVAGRAIEPLQELSATAERVAATGNLSERIAVRGDDEIGRLAGRFNAMLGALEQSMRSQRQLIADASHELRTPVTSLRTNIETLQANPGLDAGRRADLLARATAQSEELTTLMNDVIELARGDHPESGFEPLRFDELVEEAVDRARRNAPGQEFAVDLTEAVVAGSASRLGRAVNNLLDNAVKWNAPGEPIDVRLRDAELVVRDRGPGFDEAELPHVFDRFFRGGHSRERAGSGLGLAIVRQVAESHGGTATARNAPDGGAVLTLRLPLAQ